MFSHPMLDASNALTDMTPKRRSSGLIRGFLLGVAMLGVLWFLLVLAGVE